MDGEQIRQLRLRHGLTQSEVARHGEVAQSDISGVESGRRDSEALRRRVVMAILHASSPSRVLRLHRHAMRRYLTEQGVTEPRVFGSTARGEDRWNSDLDIVACVPDGASLFDLYEWERQLRQIGGGIRVDLVPESPDVLATIHASRGDMVPL